MAGFSEMLKKIAGEKFEKFSVMYLVASVWQCLVTTIQKSVHRYIQFSMTMSLA